MKIINLELIDTFALAQEDVPNRSLSERRAYGFEMCVSEVLHDQSISYTRARQIVEDSLTYLKV